MRPTEKMYREYIKQMIYPIEAFTFGIEDLDDCPVRIIGNGAQLTIKINVYDGAIEKLRLLNKDMDSLIN